MSGSAAIWTVVVSCVLAFVLAMNEQTNRLHNPDTKEPIYHQLVELLCTVTGCRIAPFGLLTSIIPTAIVILFVYNTKTVLIVSGIVLGIVLLFLRIWKTIVVLHNPDLPE